MVVGEEDVLHVRQADAERSSWRCVPSPQSISSRSPPRRTSSARRRALHGRHRAGRAEEQDGEIHDDLSSRTGPEDDRFEERQRPAGGARVQGVAGAGPVADVELLDPEFEWVNPSYAVDPGTRRGHEGFAQVMANLEDTFASRRHVLGEVHDLGDRVLWHTVFHARGHSGAEIQVDEQHLWTVRDGKILRLQWFHGVDGPSRQRSVIAAFPSTGERHAQVE